MRIHFIALVLSTCFFTFTGVHAQMSYTDLARSMSTNDPMYQQLLQNMAQNNQRTEQQVLWAMSQPDCRARYQNVLRQGVNVSYREFAYYYAVSGGFSKQGVDAYQRQSARLGQQDRQAATQYWNDLQQIKQEMQASRDQSFQNRKELGDVIAGNRHYTDHNGQRHLLPFTRPGSYFDRSSGNHYHLDQHGQYYLRTAQGYWYRMQEN